MDSSGIGLAVPMGQGAQAAFEVAPVDMPLVPGGMTLHANRAAFLPMLAFF